jgi:hypothetical protein
MQPKTAQSSRAPLATEGRFSSLFLRFDPAGTIAGCPFTHAWGNECRRAKPSHYKERAVSEPSEDFAAMFEASVQAKRLDQGELVEGRIVAIGAEVRWSTLAARERRSWISPN